MPLLPVMHVDESLCQQPSRSLTLRHNKLLDLYPRVQLFLQLRGCFPESGSFDEFWTPTSAFQVAWKCDKQGVFLWSFFPNKGISERCANICISIVNTLLYGTIGIIKGTKNPCAFVIHPGPPFVVQEALESCSLQSIWTSRRDRSWWLWLGRSQRNLCRSTCLVAFCKSPCWRIFRVNNVTLESMMAVFTCWSPSRTCAWRWGELTGMIIMTEPWYRTQIGENCPVKEKGNLPQKAHQRIRWSIIVLVDNIKQYQAMKPYALKPRSLQGFNKWVHELIRYHTVIPMCSWNLTKTLITGPWVFIRRWSHGIHGCHLRRMDLLICAILGIFQSQK